VTNGGVTPKINTSPTVRLRHCTSAMGVGHPDCSEIACASGRACSTYGTSSGAMIGRRWIRFHSSSSMKPTWMGSRRIWNAFTPTIAPAIRSRTYAFMP
jgi:hypothetical protein